MNNLLYTTSRTSTNFRAGARRSQILFILALLFVWSYPAVAADDPDELDRARRMFEEGIVLHAQMSHEFLDSYTGETQVTEGEIWISKARYKVKAEQQTILVDDDLSRVYNSAQNKLVISEYEAEEDDFAPSRFFSESEEVYTVSESHKENGVNVFVLHSDDPFELFLEVIIRIDDDLKPLEIEAVDRMENRLKTVFTDAQYLEYAETMFHLEYPDDAEIIDLRK